MLSQLGCRPRSDLLGPVYIERAADGFAAGFIAIVHHHTVDQCLLIGRVVRMLGNTAGGDVQGLHLGLPLRPGSLGERGFEQHRQFSVVLAATFHGGKPFVVADAVAEQAGQCVPFVVVARSDRDPLVVAAGWLRIAWLPSLLLMIVGKGARYALIAYLLV